MPFTSSTVEPEVVVVQPAARPDASVVVLYVEDHPVNVMIMQALLNHRPALRLVVATTGEEGVQAARAEHPDLILLDYQLPDCNGSELLAELRGLEGLGAVPAVVVTASDGLTHFDDTTFCEVWSKPLDVHRTLQAIDRLIFQDTPQALRITN